MKSRWFVVTLIGLCIGCTERERMTHSSTTVVYEYVEVDGPSVASLCAKAEAEEKDNCLRELPEIKEKLDTAGQWKPFADCLNKHDLIDEKAAKGCLTPDIEKTLLSDTTPAVETTLEHARLAVAETDVPTVESLCARTQKNERDDCLNELPELKEALEAAGQWKTFAECLDKHDFIDEEAAKGCFTEDMAKAVQTK